MTESKSTREKLRGVFDMVINDDLSYVVEIPLLLVPTFRKLVESQERTRSLYRAGLEMIENRVFDVEGTDEVREHAVHLLTETITTCGVAMRIEWDEAVDSYMEGVDEYMWKKGTDE